VGEEEHLILNLINISPTVYELQKALQIALKISVMEKSVLGIKIGMLVSFNDFRSKRFSLK
jgi:hypothetical protein